MIRSEENRLVLFGIPKYFNQEQAPDVYILYLGRVLAYFTISQAEFTKKTKRNLC